jgi:hypothetical protein
MMSITIEHNDDENMATVLVANRHGSRQVTMGQLSNAYVQLLDFLDKVYAAEPDA